MPRTPAKRRSQPTRAVRRLLLAAIPLLLVPVVGFGEDTALTPTPATSDFEGAVAVYFVTNRNRIPPEKELEPEKPDYFGDARDDLEYGV